MPAQRLPTSSAESAVAWAWRRSTRQAAAGPATAAMSASRCAAPSSSSPRPWCWRASIAARSGWIAAIVFSAEDLVTYSPVTKEHVGPGGMSMAEICEAAVTLSDNTAGNLMLASFGGPPALTAYARALGDEADAARPHRDRAQRGRTRRSARHHDARRHAGQHAAPSARRCAVGRVARAAHGLAARQQDRRQAPARRPAGGLAGRRQDRHRRQRSRQRHRHRLAAGPRADPGRRLLHRLGDHRRGAQRCHRRRRPAGGRRSRRGCRRSASVLGLAGWRGRKAVSRPSTAGTASPGRPSRCW